jgi:hypothetical protein
VLFEEAGRQHSALSRASPGNLHPQFQPKSGGAKMSNGVLGLEGETGLWTADLETGAITSVSSGSVDDLHITGRFNTRGVSVPMVAETAGPFSGGFYGK